MSQRSAQRVVDSLSTCVSRDLGGQASQQPTQRLSPVALQAEKELYAAAETGSTEDPADDVSEAPRDDECPEGREGRIDQGGLEPVLVQRCLRVIGHAEDKAADNEGNGHRPQRPGEPGHGAGTHPSYFSPMFPHAFCHDTTVQEDRLPNVTAPVTRIVS